MLQEHWWCKARQENGTLTIYQQQKIELGQHLLMSRQPGKGPTEISSKFYAMRCLATFLSLAACLISVTIWPRPMHCLHRPWLHSKWCLAQSINLWGAIPPRFWDKRRIEREPSASTSPCSPFMTMTVFLHLDQLLSQQGSRHTWPVSRHNLAYVTSCFTVMLLIDYHDMFQLSRPLSWVQNSKI